MASFDLALPLSQEAVEGTRRIAGDEHEHTLCAIGSLAALYNSMKNWTDARPLHEEALEVRRRTLGETHLETMNSMSGLGQTLAGLGEKEEGMALLEEAVDTAQRVLGGGHPSMNFSALQHTSRGEWSGLGRTCRARPLV